MKKTKATIVDIDGTIVDNRIAESIGMGTYRAANGRKKFYGLLKGLQVKTGTPIFGEEWGLENFIGALTKAEIRKHETETYCIKGLKKHLIFGAIDFLKDRSIVDDLYLITTGCDIGPKVIAEMYNIETNWVANKIIYEDNKVVGCNIIVTEENIGNHVKNIISKYESAIIIDDRPERYKELRLHDNIEIYDNIESALNI